jgi:hypothetical protein
VKTTVREKLLELFGLGLKAKATDGASPQELADYAMSSARALDEDPDEEKKKKEAEDARRMKDAAEEEEKEKKKKEAEDRKRAEDAKAAADKIARDSACKPGEDGHKKCTADKCMAKDRGANDADGGDHRSRMHAALDNMLDKHEKMHGPLEGEDADMEELKDLMGKFLSEEQQEPEHAGDELEMIEPVGDPVDPNQMANDAASELLPVIEQSREKRTLQKAFDAALAVAFDAADAGEFEFLKAIKPTIAKSRDEKVRKAFDALCRKYTRTSRASEGSYAAFGASAQARDTGRIAEAARAAAGNGARLHDNTKITEIYKGYRDGKSPINTR